MKTLLLIFSITITPLLAKENVGHILYFQTLSELPESQALNYIKNVRHILSQSLSYELTQSLKADSSASCIKKKKQTCHPGLYGENICVSKKQKATIACAKAGKKKRFSTFFADPALHRVSWNSLGLRINKACSKKKDFSCIKLFQLKESTLKHNRKHLEQIQKRKTSH